MKKFSDYVNARNEDVDPSMNQSDDSSDSSSADQGSDDGLMAACQIAATKYRSQLEKFLMGLADNDSELKSALDGQEQTPVDNGGDSNNVTTQPVADMA